MVPSGFPEANVSQHVAILRPRELDSGRYLHVVIRSPYFQGLIVASQTGAGRGGLPKNRMDAPPVPRPPPDEQRRLVAKVDELMALCDRLEAALTLGDTTRSKLLDALIAEALASPAPVNA